MATTHLHVRDTRDRLIDLLGIGQTYPLQDLPVRDEQLMVAFNTAAKIPVEYSQQGVLYQLHDHRVPVERTPEGERGPGVPIEAEGNGGTIFLETYKIQEDITFEILARKQYSSREAYLHQTATVKVGLDITLNAWIREVPYLDPTVENPTNTTPRIIHYGTSVTVEIESSQEGVDYKLVYFQGEEEVVLSETDERGNLHNIILTTEPVYEDADVRIRATKTFDPAEHRDTQTALLDVVLPLKVRANPALAVAVDPVPIIDFNQVPIIKIANTQPSVTYRLYKRPIPDRDFVHKPDTDKDVIKISVAGAPDAQVIKPPRQELWDLPEGYTAWGEAQRGSGGELQFTTEPLTDDSLIIVQAAKTHQISQDPQANQTLPSAIQLEQAAVVLVRPDPAPPLRLKVLVVGAETGGDLEVFDGQPGVFYYFRADPDGHALGLPAYFHKNDDQDKTMNKGLDQLKIEVDFVLARALPGETAGIDLARTPPQPPLLETGPLPTGSNLHILAVKAQTQVATPLNYIPQISTNPEVGPEETVVDYGAKTRIRIKASQVREWYQLLLDGKPLADPVKGTGRDRLLETGALWENTTIELLITQPDEPIKVERLFRFAILVRPESE
ncbi:MAG: hypothetical protein KDJ52_00930 [Anaerolineae bacterium]|nr:hypothetical protein [Anaerolineae bacterium]